MDCLSTVGLALVVVSGEFSSVSDGDGEAAVQCLGLLQD